jgi:hypothetical protein
MSLTDLKRNKGEKSKKKNFTIDEFISDAEDYAKGKPKIVSELSQDKVAAKQSLEEAIAEAKRYVEMTEAEHKRQQNEENQTKNKPEKPFRRATFTLSEGAISQLHELSKGTDLAKSHILRILIDELCNKEQNEQLKKLLQSRID